MNKISNVKYQMPNIKWGKSLLRFSTLFYPIVLFALFLYSFTQIDLGLALTRFPFLYGIQRGFQYIGYFNRPLSTTIYIVLLLLLFVLYGAFLWLAHKEKISRKQAWKLFFVTAGILVFSYNAFSYDLFNYIFDAKIVTYYHQNPYEHKALDYPQDPMLSFMHWTHRVYPYGPVWLGMTIPLSFLGMHYFLPTFFLFKVLITGCYLGTIYFIGRVRDTVVPHDSVFAMIFFGLNPLVIIESLVSAHVDIVMMFIAMASVYLLVKKRYFISILLLLLSIGVKFATVFLLPVFLTILVLQIMKEKVPWRYVFLTAIACMLLAVLASSQKSGNFQPWYILLVLPIASLIGRLSYVLLPTIIISLISLGAYIPFLFLGNWDTPVPTILTWLYVCGITLSIIAPVVYYFGRTKHS
jgi:hypothetical protein